MSQYIMNDLDNFLVEDIGVADRMASYVVEFCNNVVAYALRNVGGMFAVVTTASYIVTLLAAIVFIGSCVQATYGTIRRLFMKQKNSTNNGVYKIKMRPEMFIPNDFGLADASDMTIDTHKGIAWECCANGIFDAEKAKAYIEMINTILNSAVTLRKNKNVLIHCVNEHGLFSATKARECIKELEETLFKRINAQKDHLFRELRAALPRSQTIEREIQNLSNTIDRKKEEKLSALPAKVVRP